MKDVDNAISSALAMSAQGPTELRQRGREDIMESSKLHFSTRHPSVRIYRQSSARNSSPQKTAPSMDQVNFPRKTAPLRRVLSKQSPGSMDNDLDQVLDGLRGLETRMHLDSLQRANSSLPPSGLWNDPLNPVRPDAQLSEGIVARPHEAESAGAEWSDEVRSLTTRLQNIIVLAEGRSETEVAPVFPALLNNGNVESALNIPGLQSRKGPANRQLAITGEGFDDSCRAPTPEKD